MNSEGAKIIHHYTKAIIIILGLCCIAVGAIFLLEFFYSSCYNMSKLWPVFPVIAGIGITITAICSKKSKSIPCDNQKNQ
jgi:hypothetical protein